MPEVIVTGHTDTTGSADQQLRARAEARDDGARRCSIEAGLDAAAIEVTSHGEADLLVRDAGRTYEPRNRRVEITIR